MMLLLLSLLLDLRRALVLGSLGRAPSLVAVVFSLFLDVVLKRVGGVVPRFVLVI